jgi:hypothetical protein
MAAAASIFELDCNRLLRNAELINLASGRARLELGAGTPAVLTGIIRGFPQSIQVNSAIRLLPVSSKSFPVHQSSYVFTLHIRSY